MSVRSYESQFKKFKVYNAFWCASCDDVLLVFPPFFYGVGAFYDVLPRRIVGDTDGVLNIPILTEIFKYGG